MTETSLQNRYLVIARVGDHSLHPEWMHPAEYRNFDLFLSYYGNTPGRYAQDCEYYSAAKGPKWPKIYDLFKTMGERIFQYDAVWFPDDDIRTHPGNISRMFELFTENKLQLAQPALTANSYFPVTAQYIDYKLRYTRFIEIMAPIFSREALRICHHTFNKSVTGWGMEYVWAKLLGYPDKGMAILDATPVKHTRPPGQGDLYENMKKLKIDIWDPKNQDVWKEYGIETQEPSEITYYGGVKEWDPFAALEDPEEAVQQKPDNNEVRKAGKIRKKIWVKRKPARAVRRTGKPPIRKPAAGKVRKRIPIRRKPSAPPFTLTKFGPRRGMRTRSRTRNISSRLSFVKK